MNCCEHNNEKQFQLFRVWPRLKGCGFPERPVEVRTQPACWGEAHVHSGFWGNNEVRCSKSLLQSAFFWTKIPCTSSMRTLIPLYLNSLFNT